VSPRNVVAEPNAVYQFEARLLGGATGGVSWRLLVPGGESGAWGTISEAGLYKAPDELPNPPIVRVLAHSLSDPSKASTAEILIRGIAIRILGTPTLLYLEHTAQLHVRVGGTDDSAVLWSVEEGLEHGTVTTTGLYSAPATLPDPPRARIRATLEAHPNKSSVVEIRLATEPPPPPPPPPVLVGISPATASLRLDASETFTAVVTNSADHRVVWSVDGGFPFGTITGNGVYRAPAILPDPPQATIRATSMADPSISATATVGLRLKVRVTISPPTITLNSGETYQFTATVRHADDPGVIWSVGGGGDVTSSGFFTSPYGLNDTRQVHIIATSVEDPTASATARATVVSLLSSAEADRLLQLGQVGYQLVQISDQAVGAALSVLNVAYRLNGNQIVTTGILRRTEAGYVYEAGDGMTTLRVIGSGEPIELTVTEATGYPGVTADPGALSHIDFVGTLWCRLQVGTSLDLRILQTSSRLPLGVAFNRTVRGTIDSGPIRRFGVTHNGESYLAAHYGFGRHEVVGGATMLNGAEVSVDEDIDLQFA